MPRGFLFLFIQFTLEKVKPCDTPHVNNQGIAPLHNRHVVNHQVSLQSVIIFQD